jgi:hypothetical protein
MAKKKVLTPEILHQRIKMLVDKNKFLSNPKYYKNNIVLVPHFESISARTEHCSVCGERGCETIHNKRIAKCFDDRSKLIYGQYCSVCIDAIENHITFRFNREYCG